MAAVAPERSSLAYGPVVPEEHNSSRSITPRAIISSFQRGSPEVFLLPSSSSFTFSLSFFFFTLRSADARTRRGSPPIRVHAYAYLTPVGVAHTGCMNSARSRARIGDDVPVISCHFISPLFSNSPPRIATTSEPCLPANCEMLKSRDDRFLVHPVESAMRLCARARHTYIDIHTRKHAHTPCYNNGGFRELDRPNRY